MKKGGKKARRTGKKGKKKKEKDLTPDRTTESLFEELVVNGILVKYPEFSMKSYLGDRSYSARAPTNPAPGDIRQVIKEYCILPLGSQIIRNFAPCIKSILIAGRRSKAYAELTVLIRLILIASLHRRVAIRSKGNRQAIARPGRRYRDRIHYVRPVAGQPRRQISGKDWPHHAHASRTESFAVAATSGALL